MIVPDSVTQAYLKPVKNDIGLLRYLLEDEFEEISDAELHPHQYAISPKTGKINSPIVYELNPEDIDHLFPYLEMNGRCDRGRCFLVKSPHYDDNINLLFNHKPSQQEIKIAYVIRTITIWIESGEVDQHIKCGVCGNEAHWSNTKCCSVTEISNIVQRAMMLNNNICSYSELSSTPTTKKIEVKVANSQKANP